MRGKVLGFVGVVAVGALGVDCGPPPVPFNGTLNYSIRSEQMLGGPPPINLDEPIVMAQPGSGGTGNSLVLRCTLQRQASGNVLFSVTMCRSGGGSCDSGRGVTFCGEVSPNGLPQMASRGSVSLYVNGASGQGQVPGNCQITVRNLSNNRDPGSQNPNSISGSITCTGLPNMSVSGQTLNLRGRGSPGVEPDATMDPMAADFEVVSCPMSSAAVNCI